MKEDILCRDKPAQTHSALSLILWPDDRASKYIHRVGRNVL
jgi:hypothetical protein